MAKQQISESEWLYTGVIHEQARQIRSDRLLVAPTPYIFLRRLELLEQESEEAQAFNNYVHTSEAVMYSRDGTFKFMQDFWNKADL